MDNIDSEKVVKRSATLPLPNRTSSLKSSPERWPELSCIWISSGRVSESCQWEGDKSGSLRSTTPVKLFWKLDVVFALLLGGSELLHCHSSVPHSVCLFYEASHSLLHSLLPGWEVFAWVSCLYSAYHIGTVETLGSVWHRKGTSEYKQVVVIVEKQNLDLCWALVKTLLHFPSLSSLTRMNFTGNRF